VKCGFGGRAPGGGDGQVLRGVSSGRVRRARAAVMSGDFIVDEEVRGLVRGSSGGVFEAAGLRGVCVIVIGACVFEMVPAGRW